MRTRTILAAALCLAAASTAAQAVPSQSYYRPHELHSLDYRVAETLAWEVCREIGSTFKDPCKVDSASDHKLVLLGPPEAHARLVEILAERDPPERGLQRFELRLMRGRRGGTGAAVGPLPPGVASALAGLEEFLPSTRFELVASGSLRTSGRGELELAGTRDERYRVALDYRGRRTGRGPGTLFVDVAVTEVGPREKSEERSLVSATLSVDLGETIVVGSSAAGDGDVLVLLLSAPG
jgi:hypothetical protein